MRAGATIEICFHHPCCMAIMSVVFRQADLSALSSTCVYPAAVRTNTLPKLRWASLLGVRNQTTRHWYIV